nr:ATP synthase F0 subunit 6 [Guaduella macrostachys]
MGQRIYVQVACLTNRRLRTVVSLFRWSDPTMESVDVSNRDCVGVQSTVHVHVLKIRLSLEKPRTTPISVSFLFSGAELKKNRNATMDRQRERRIFQFDEASLNSNESSVRTMTEGSNTNPSEGSVRTMTEGSNTSNATRNANHRIFKFDEASLNSNESSVRTMTEGSNTNPSEGSVRTMTEGSNTSNATNLNGIQGDSTGIYEDHPGLNPSDERVVEYQGAIREETQRLMIGRDPQEVLAAAERIHGESNNIEFLQGLWADLRNNGTESEAFKVAMKNFSESPLDQFSIHPIIPLNIGNYYFSFTNPSLSMLLTLGLVLLLLFVVTKKGGGKSVPNAWQSLVELIYDFVLDLVNEQIGGLSGNVKQKFFPRISVTFTFSLFRNPQGMIPFSFTVTSHFLITLALSFSIFIGITIVGFQRHGLHFFSFLLPAGVPLPLAPFLVLLELIPHCFRALSSGIRLFANMMAGHSSVKILSGFAWTMLFLNNIFYFIGDLGPLFIVLALTGLELGVAISQAHVSTISICIYLNDATNLHQNESFHN